MIRKLKAVPATVWQAFDDVKWLPYAVALLLLMIVNFPS